MIQDVMAPVVQGTLNAIAIANQVRQSMLQERRLQQMEEREQRQARVEDIRTRLELDRAGRPVVGGAVAVDVPVPKLEAPPGMIFPEQAPIRTLRPVVPESVVKWKDLAGVERQYELKSEDEQFAEELRRRVDQAQAMQEAQRVEIPATMPEAGERVDPRSLSYLLGLQRQMIEDQRARTLEAGRNTRARETEAGRITRAQAAETGRAARATQAVTSREKVAAMPARRSLGRTEGQTDVQGRFDQREKKRVEGEIAKLDARLVAEHAEAQRFGDLSRLAVGEQFLDDRGEDKKMTDLYRARYAQKAREAKAKAETTRQERDRLARSIGWRETTGAAGAAATGALSPAGEAYLQKLTGGR